MISAVAVSLALAFWSPYNGDQQPVPYQPIPCQASDVHVVTPQQMPQITKADGFAFTSDEDNVLLPPHCDIYIAVRVTRYSIAGQCSVMAHEWGHAWKQLGHSLDPHNVMYADPNPPPATCYPPREHIKAKLKISAHVKIKPDASPLSDKSH